jgi:hypothetical protein
VHQKDVVGRKFRERVKALALQRGQLFGGELDPVAKRDPEHLRHMAGGAASRDNPEFLMLRHDVEALTVEPLSAVTTPMGAEKLAKQAFLGAFHGHASG